MRRPSRSTAHTQARPAPPPGLIPLMLLGAAAASRLAAFPASIWDQDEAYFTAAVLHFDPIHSQPHPPFFPLWIALGKAFHAMAPAARPELGLMLAGAVASSLLVVLLYSLWCRAMAWQPAAAAALLFALAPGPWILSGRAYTEPTATTLLLAGALLLDRRHGPPDLAAGLALAAAILVRPQWTPLAGILCLWFLVRERGIRRVLPLATAVVLGAGAAGLVAHAAGGLAPLLEAVRTHAAYQARTLGRFTFSLRDLALVPALGGAVPAAAWAVLALVGGVALGRHGPPFARRFMALVLLPQLALFLAFQNPTLPRYAIPLLAESSGLVVAGLVTLLGSNRRGAAAALAACGLWLAVVVPHLHRYRTHPSPAAQLVARLRGRGLANTILVADHHLAPLLTLARAEGGSKQRVVWDWAVALGRFASPPREDLVAMWDGERPRWARGGRVERIGTPDRFLAGIASPRYRALALCRRCAVAPPEERRLRPLGRSTIAPERVP